MTSEELRFLLNNTDFFEAYDQINNLPSNEYPKDAEEILMRAVVDNIGELVTNPRLLSEEYEDILYAVLEIARPQHIVGLINLNVDVEEILKFSNMKFNLADIQALSDEERKVFADKLGTYLSLDIQQELMPNKSSQEIVEEKIAALANGIIKPEHIMDLVDGMEEEDKLKLIELGIALLDGNSLAKIAKGMSEENRLKVIELGISRLDGNNIAQITEGMNEKVRLKVIEERISQLDGNSIVQITEGMSEENKLKAIELGINKLGGHSIAQIIKEMSEEKKLETIKEYKNFFDSKGLGYLIAVFDERNSEIDKYLEDFLKASNFPLDNMDFCFKMLQNFDARIFDNSGNAAIFKKETEAILGQEVVYDLIKFYIYTGEVIPVDRILEEPEVFKQYKEFRKTFKEEKQMQIMNDHDAIVEFNEHAELIKEFLGEELTPQELEILKVALKEREVNIETKEELGEFSKKRYERIEELINDNSKEALIYILTGMTVSEYEERLKTYINSEQIRGMIKDFDQVDTEFLIIQAQNEIIELISGLDEEKRQEILRIFNKELANEFGDGGSRVAESRAAFEDIEIRLRKVYGKELSEALKESSLPDAKIDEVDKEVEVIELRGEDFKLLIHGIDAFSKSSGMFEKREVGKTYLSTSLISEKTLARANAQVYYGFRNIGSNALIQEGICDMFSNAYKDNSLEVKADHGIEFKKTENLLDATSSYNEVALWREYTGDDGKTKNTFPDYIVCFDTISQRDREEAKRLKIPIALIDQKAYTKGKEHLSKDNLETEIPKEPEQKIDEIKTKMLEVMRNASDKSSALLQQEALEKIVNEMQKELQMDKDSIDR